MPADAVELAPLEMEACRLERVCEPQHNRRFPSVSPFGFAEELTPTCEIFEIERESTFGGQA